MEPAGVSDKLQSLRGEMKIAGVDGYLIPHEDEHSSEYTAPNDERLAYISGFTGSAGTAMVMADRAFIWVDSRYYVQAENEVEKGWEIQRLGEAGVKKWWELTAEVMTKGQKFAYDPALTFQQGKKMMTQFLEPKEIEIVSLAKNLVDELWTPKPKAEEKEIFVLPDNTTGKSYGMKLKAAGEFLDEKKSDILILAELDQIAWFFNLRGSDIPYNPVFFSYAIVRKSPKSQQWTGHLFVNLKQLEAKTSGYLREYGVTLNDKSFFWSDVAALKDVKVVLSNNANLKIVESLSEEGKNNSLHYESPIEMMKARKNETEIKGMRNCQIRDGAAVIAYFAWLEKELNPNGKTDINEFGGAMKLRDFRAKQVDYFDLSFEAISSIGPNGAIIHYAPKETGSATINNKEVYLLDSGGQYLDGTTDTTRTVHFGTPSDEEKEMYTRVLKCNLDLERINVPNNQKITGGHLEVLARRHLWSTGKDFGHSTGHGVGHFLNVHEMPPAIHLWSKAPLEEGYIFSNEPGYYKVGHFGIRIENVMVCKNSEKHAGFFEFENLTLVPYARELLDLSLLTKDDLDHLNKYHQEVAEKVKPVLQSLKEYDAIDWLERMTAPITRA